MFKQAGLKLPETPIRAELFGVERLEQHAQTLAAAQLISPVTARGRPLAKRLYDNTKVLTETYLAVVRAHSAQQPIKPAAEWLLDNFHIVDEQIREIKSDLPPGFYRKLPKLAAGPLQGYPRVFGIAWAVVAHTDSAFDAERLKRFVDAYQRVNPLTIGELWALSITLRITLVENLRRLAEAITAQQSAIHLADRLADQFSKNADGSAEVASKALRELDQAPWSAAFAVELAQRLRDHDPHTTPELHWLNKRLAAEGTSIEDIVRQEFQTQSAIDVTVRNVIMSMRLVSMINWAEFFESVSPVDAVLRSASDFAAMDFPSRDLYRHAIEEIARESRVTEVDVAQRAVASSARAKVQNADHPTPELCQNDPG